MSLRLLYGGFKGGSPVVNLDGHTIHNTRASPLNCSAAVRINTDGTVDRRNGSGTFSQIDSATDWIIPNSAALSTYEVMAHVDSGALTAGDAEDTWLDLTSDRAWQCIQGGVPGTEAAIITVSIRLGSGATIDTGVYDLEARVT